MIYPALKDAKKGARRVHNYISKRSRLLREIRDASTAYLWHMNTRTAQGRRATTLAARRLMERARDLWKLGNFI